MVAIRRILFVALAGAGFIGAAPGVPAGKPVVPPVVPLAGKLGTPIPLFNGKDASGWLWHGTIPGSKLEETFTVKNGVLHCAAVKSNATGFIDTDKAYKNYVLTIDYRHITPANGGIFICIAGEEKVWPDALQVQGKFGAVGDLFNQNTGMKKMTTDPARTRVAAKDILVTRIKPADGQVIEKPLGEWNTLVITIENGNLSVTNNGILVNTATEVTPNSGKIGIQAEAAEMEFRKIELVPIEN